MNKPLPRCDDRSDVAHITYGLDMRDGLWHARCGCGWEGTPSPDVGAQAATLDEHLRRVVADQQPGPGAGGRVEALALRAFDRNLLLGAVALGMALFGGLAAWAEHHTASA